MNYADYVSCVFKIKCCHGRNENAEFVHVVARVMCNVSTTLQWLVQNNFVCVTIREKPTMMK